MGNFSKNANYFWNSKKIARSPESGWCKQLRPIGLSSHCHELGPTMKIHHIDHCQHCFPSGCW